MQTSAIRDHVAFYVRQHGTAALARVLWSRLWSATIGTPEWLYSIDLEGLRSCAPSISDSSDLAVVPFHRADELDAPTIAQLRTFKSELSLYFPDYDEVIGNDPKEDRKLQVRRSREFVVDLL